MVKNLPAMPEMWARSLGQEDPLEKGIATHSSILAWRIPWTEEPGGLQSTSSQRVGHDRVTFTSFFLFTSPPVTPVRQVGDTGLRAPLASPAFLCLTQSLSPESAVSHLGGSGFMITSTPALGISLDSGRLCCKCFPRGLIPGEWCSFGALHCSWSRLAPGVSLLIHGSGRWVYFWESRGGGFLFSLYWRDGSPKLLALSQKIIPRLFCAQGLVPWLFIPHGYCNMCSFIQFYYPCGPFPVNSCSLFWLWILFYFWPERIFPSCFEFMGVVVNWLVFSCSQHLFVCVVGVTLLLNVGRMLSLPIWSSVESRKWWWFRLQRLALLLVVRKSAKCRSSGGAWEGKPGRRLWGADRSGTVDRNFSMVGRFVSG